VPARLIWSQGGSASLEVLDGERIEVLSSRAFAPGSRPAATLEEGGHPVWMKVHNSRRQEDGSFRVVGRLLNVTREVRDLLKGAVAPPNDAKSPTS
jgi:hypothetical protein